MNEKILRPEIQAFLHQHIATAPSTLALRKSPFTGVTAAELANQLDGLQRSRKKLPLWFKSPEIYFPSLLSIEQTSSDITAAYKSRLIKKGCSILDLTGGFGVDSYYFSQVAKKVIHCERDSELSEIAAHNARKLQSYNTDFIVGDGLRYLKENNQEIVDVIYVDPSRRVKQQKVFRLSDCEPDIVTEAAFLLKKARKLIIKAAPLLDIKAAFLELPPVKEVHIVSVQNECKELLFIIDAGHTAPPIYHCVSIDSKHEKTFTFSQQQEENSFPLYSQPMRYLYEPTAALLKGGGFRSIAVSYGLKKLHQHTHLYTAETLNKSFAGRIFEVTSVMSYSDFKKSKLPRKANVSSRNFPLKPIELKKKHRIIDGGTDYLFFCTGPSSELLVVHCKKESAT